MQLSLIQPLFDFACCAWYPNLSMSLKNKLQTAENACIRFCLGQERRSHIRVNQFQKINRLPVKKKVDKWIAVTAYNFKNNLSSVYVSDIYIYSQFFSGCKNKKFCGQFCRVNIYEVYMNIYLGNQFHIWDVKFGMDQTRTPKSLLNIYTKLLLLLLLVLFIYLYVYLFIPIMYIHICIIYIYIYIYIYIIG